MLSIIILTEMENIKILLFHKYLMEYDKKWLLINIA